MFWVASVTWICFPFILNRFCVIYLPFFNSISDIKTKKQMYQCIHCKLYLSESVSAIVKHSEICKAMVRKDSFKHRYGCYRCLYFTYEAQNLKKHVLKHIGEKPFSCNICNYRSIQKVSLKLHLLNHHKIILK